MSLLLLAAPLVAAEPDAPREAVVDPIKTLTDLGGQFQPAMGAEPTQLSFRDCSKLGEAEFKLISGLSNLKKLTLYGSCKGLNNETMPLLTKLANLEELNTDGISVTDDGLKPLAQLANLKAMSFFHPSWGSKEFIGTGVAHFAPMTKLERLTIAGSPFNDEGMAAVGKLTQLTSFSTWHTFQTEAGNQHLLPLKNLKALRLGQRLRKYDGKPSPPSLSDETLDVLVQMKSLENLGLDEAKLSRTALAKLHSLPNLKKLSLERIAISVEDIELLKKDLPNVTIDFKPMTEEQASALEKMIKP
ncbi:hypothetical protein [Anatilimnocola floriformis]|uniref:hypothetical protein n=1 Tax=Anatilimnocola floriformis TaxID=2948575 RepID=UPI0020C5844F|nr:hypothetical protein [Anatilimnocola floriformis]